MECGSEWVKLVAIRRSGTRGLSWRVFGIFRANVLTGVWDTRANQVFMNVGIIREDSGKQFTDVRI